MAQEIVSLLPHFKPGVTGDNITAFYVGFCFVYWTHSLFLT